MYHMYHIFPGIFLLCPKCRSCHKAIMVITVRAHCNPLDIYLNIFRVSTLFSISEFCMYMYVCLQKMAAASSGSSQMEDSLSCGICLEKYDTSDHLPKALPCLHTFCSSCMDTLIAAANNYIECPMCRRKVL